MDLSKLQNGSDVRGVALAGVENEPVTLDDAAVRAILRSGLYQARYLKSVPVRAAISESVTLTRQMGKSSAAGLVNAVLRRAAAAVPAPAASTLRFGDIVLDDVSRTVRVGGVPVELTFKEYALLHLFLEHPEEVLARERIMKDVWDTDNLLESRTIDMHVRTLRQKLGAAGEAIRTVRKVGYKLSTEGSDD